jgi:hypothetical protein
MHVVQSTDPIEKSQSLRTDHSSADMEAYYVEGDAAFESQSLPSDQGSSDISG